MLLYLKTGKLRFVTTIIGHLHDNVGPIAYNAILYLPGLGFKEPVSTLNLSEDQISNTSFTLEASSSEET